MSKALKIAGMIVAIVAITVVTAGIGTAPAIAASGAGLGAVAGVAATGAGLFGLSAAALTAIGTGLTLAGNLTAKKPSPSGGGTQTQWQANPSAGIPYAMGRTMSSGNIVHQGGYGGTDNPYQSFVTVYSGAGPIDSFESFAVSKAVTTFSGGAAVGSYSGYMWLTSQPGAQPQAAALTPPYSGLPGWSVGSRLSGKAATMFTLKYDSKGKKFPSGVPKLSAIIKGVRVYDPRLDSTFPGGSGAQRANNESTWSWSANPWLHALTYAIGRRENGVRTIGVGMPIDAIEVSAFVEAANIADANSWALGGVVYSTDDKWNVLKQMTQAGGGEPIRQGAMLSAFVNAPRVSLATITADDLADGDIKITAMQARRDRVNGEIPRYRSEAHDWEIVPGDVVRVATYRTEDGEDRTREVEYPLVQSVTQASQMAAYNVANAREFGPILLPLKPKWISYRTGDCVTVNIPDANLNNQSCVILRREIDPGSGIVMLTLRSETTAKHAFALGLTGTAPPTPALSSRNEVPAAPSSAAWALTPATLAAGGWVMPALSLAGGADNPGAESIIVEYRVSGTTPWVAGGDFDPASTRIDIAKGVMPATIYDVAISYRVRGVVGDRLVLGPVTTVAQTGDFANIGGATRPEGYASSSDNMVANGSLATDAANWYLIGSVARLQATSPAEASTGFFQFVASAGNAQASANSGSNIALNGATKIYVNLDSYTQAGATGGFFVQALFYRSDGTPSLTVPYIQTSIQQATTGLWLPIATVWPVPADATHMGVILIRAPSTGAVYATNLRVAKTQPAADVTIGSPVGLATIKLAADYQGVVKAGQLPKTIYYTLAEGEGTNVTTLAVWSVVVKGGSITCAIGVATGALSITALASDAIIELTATYNGATRSVTVTVLAEKDAPPVTGSGAGTSATDSTITGVSSTAYSTAKAGPLTVKAGSGGSVNLSAPLEFARPIDGNGTRDAYGKWQWRVVGGSWADVSAEVLSTSPAFVTGYPFEPESYNGFISIAPTKSGLTAGTDYEFQLLLRCAGTATVLDFYGTATATGA